VAVLIEAVIPRGQSLDSPGDAAGEAGGGVGHLEPIAAAQTVVEVAEQRLESLVLATRGGLVTTGLLQTAIEPVGVLARFQGVSEPALDRLAVGIDLRAGDEIARRRAGLLGDFDVPEEAPVRIVGVTGAEGLHVT